MPKAATRGPGMLMIYIRVLASKPTLKYLELPRQFLASLLATPCARDRITKNVDSFMNIVHQFC
jgi:hypothetical protein